MPGGNVKREGCFVGGEAARRAITVIAVLFILSSIATSTVLALRQAKEQNAAMRTLEASGRLKHDLDEVQQMMLDEHGELYTLIGTRPFYKRAAYIFPLPALLALTDDARRGCRQNARCLSRLAGEGLNESFATSCAIKVRSGEVVVIDAWSFANGKPHSHPAVLRKLMVRFTRYT
jgi:hypothetical protein